MNTFIINLEKAEKRREQVIREAEKAGLDFTVMPAVDGSTLSDEEIAELCDTEVIEKFPDWLTKGAIGCALSHINVYKKIVERSLPCALVLEDDVELAADFYQTINSIASMVSEFDICLLHYTSFAPLELSITHSTHLFNDYRLMHPMFLKGVNSAACYVITYNAAESLLKRLLPIRLAADSFFEFRERGMVKHIRCVYPRPAGVIGAKSTIEVTNQSQLRVWMTNTIERLEIPILYDLLKKLRLRTVDSRSQISVVSMRSPLDDVV